MTDAEHEWAWEALAAHAAGELSPEEGMLLDAHLAGCPDCSEELLRLREPEPIPEEPSSKHKLRARMVASLRQIRDGAPRSRVARGILAGAAIVFVGIIGLIFAELEADRGLLMTADPGEILLMSNSRAPAAAVRDREELSRPYTEPAPSFPEAMADAADSEHWMQSDSSEVLGYIRGDAGSFRGHQSARGQASLETRGVGRGAGGAGSSGGKLAQAMGQPKTVPSFFKPGDALTNARQWVSESQDEEPKRPEVRHQVASGVTRDAQPQEETPKLSRKIIRSGEMEFEIAAFDAAVATVTRITLEEQGTIATVNSEKLQNGKVRGTVVVRIPPDNLDRLLLKLRALGDLKSQRIGSEDVTKSYLDLESRLRAARTMEERLLAIIRDGKGAIKDLLLAEKELGEWRTKIESMTGEINYYSNLIAHSTLTITLFEKEIRAPFALLETERVEMAVEVEDVEKAHRDALAGIAEAKGRVTKSELKQYAAGQYNAIVQFEVAPEQAGVLRDRLKQLGAVARLDINRGQESLGGTGKAQDAQVQRHDTQILLSLYNLANLSPRETVHVDLACVDAEKATAKVLERVEKASGRVLSSNLSRPKSDQTTGRLSFQINRAEADAVLRDIRGVGEVIKLDVTEDPDAANATRSKRGFNVNLYSMGLVQPRETSTVVLAAKDVSAGYRGLIDTMKAAGVRIVSAQLNESDQRNVTADLSIEALREHEEAIAAALAKAGDVYTRTSTRAQDSENVVDSKIALTVRFFNAASIPPRETVKIGLDVGDADVAVKAIEADFKGRVVDTRHSQTAGQRESVLTIEIPHQELIGALDRIKGLGSVREQSTAKNAGVPDNALALARIEVRLGHEMLMGQDSGPLANMRRGLSISLQAASWALMLMMIGVCFVLPLLLLFWMLAKIHRMLRPKAEPAAPAVPAA